ncbi:Polyneuridine-aldehyde esterase [Bertholletia excelsa]
MERSLQQMKHFVLVHGCGHGAWCWYKLQPLLESAGHRVTALDLAAAGENPAKISDLQTFRDYSKPLLDFMASIPEGEKVIIVGHSLGGMNISLAMEEFPEKIAAGVFLAAFMPDTVHEASFVKDKFLEAAGDVLLDTKFVTYGSQPEPHTGILLGPKCLASKLYQLCPVEDLALAKMLVREGSFFHEDLAKAEKFTNERYGSVTRVYILCANDNVIVKEFQRWMIENSGVTEVKEIDGADHMAMLSAPQQLSDHLLDIAIKCA